MKCCICKGEIAVHGTWAEGHNAEPVVEDGRCCDSCNDTVVIPTRLRAVGVDVEIGQPLGLRSTADDK
jgi:hypothetical protein